MKTYKLFAALCPLAFVFASCIQELPDTPGNVLTGDGTRTITINATIGDDPASRTVFSGSGSSYSAAWEAGDQIYVLERIRATALDEGYYDKEFYANSGRFAVSSELASGGTTASFTVTLTDLSELYGYDDLMANAAHYQIRYEYFATTQECYYCEFSGDDPYINLMMIENQNLTPGGLSTGDDLLVSPFVSKDSRPTELSLPFARIGTVVKINLSGLQPGDIIQSGTWKTGNNFCPASASEGNGYNYYPDYGEVRRATGEMMGGGVGHLLGFTCDTDTESKKIVANASGEATLFLRTYAGEIADEFTLIVNVIRDDGGTPSTVTLSKYVDLASRNAKLKFKESGLTEFAVALKPAVVSIPDVMYTTSESANRDGFTAVWETIPHVASYECYYYCRYNDETEVSYDPDYDEITKIPLTPTVDAVNGITYVSVASGLAKGWYVLYIKANPDSEAGPLDNEKETDLQIGRTVSLSFINNATAIDGIPGFYTIANPSGFDPESATIQAENVYFGTYIGDYIKSADGTNAWWFKNSASQTFPGGLEHLEFELRKRAADEYFNAPTVYGILSDLSEVALNGTAAETKVEKTDSSLGTKYYQCSYNLEGYAGFKVAGASSTLLQRVSLHYYK